MIGKVIHNGEEYVVKNQYSDLPLKPDGPNKTQLIEMVEKKGFAFVDFEVETIAEGTMAPKIAVKSRFALVDAGFHPQTMYYTLNFALTGVDLI